MTRPTSPGWATVFQCPECDQRYLDERRCPDCNLFCRRLDRGGNCPHCDEPVAISDLSPDTPQEATTRG